MLRRRWQIAWRTGQNGTGKFIPNPIWIVTHLAWLGRWAFYFPIYGLGTMGHRPIVLRHWGLVGDYKRSIFCVTIPRIWDVELTSSQKVGVQRICRDMLVAISC